MDLSIFLAQLLGLYFILGGLIFLLRRRSLIPVVKEFSVNRALLFLLALLELAAGLALVIAHPVYTFDWKGLITFLGGWMIIESVFFLLVPNKWARFLIQAVNKPRWYTFGGVIAIVLGFYLAGKGFGFF